MALILYGSLFPFRFHQCSETLFATSVIPSDRGDLLSNILLYIPLGFFASRAWRGFNWAIPASTVLGAALSLFIELAQQCDQSRVASLADVAANAAGALIGSLIAIDPRLDFVALLAACWLASRVLPFLPSVHVHKYWLAIKAAAAIPAPLDVFRYFALWLAAAALLGEFLLPAIAIVLACRILVIDLTLVPAEIAGAILAAVSWRFTHSKRLVAAVFALFVIVSALEPFHFLRTPRPFGWVPFLSFMTAARESASRSFLEKSFMYGALLWLSVRAGLRFAAVVPAAAALVFALRFAQTYLPGRSAEITDALMVLMAAATMKLMRA
jgi:VanZ family protein